MPDRTFVIDCFPASAARYRDDHAIVAIDVIRATTLAVTAAASGRRCLIAADLDDAIRLRDSLGDAILAGDLGGHMPFGFDMNNSPADLVERQDVERPLVMLSTSGTELMLASAPAEAAYAVCLRNVSATARYVAPRHDRIAIIGAGSRGEFREEDQLGCAWLAARLTASGFRPADAASADVAARWEHEPVSAIASGNSVGYLRRTDQVRDYDFIVERLDDVADVCAIVGNEIESVSAD
jgi:2-phosphosulfolactate phosphatase